MGGSGEERIWVEVEVEKGWDGMGWDCGYSTVVRRAMWMTARRVEWRGGAGVGWDSGDCRDCQVSG